MNPVEIHSTFSALPEGVGQDKLRQRTCCLLGLAAGTMVPLPAAETSPNDLRTYFTENSGVIRSAMFKVNEVIPFDVDRALEYGFRIFERRYSLAYNCCPHEMFAPNLFAQTLGRHIPEFEGLGIGSTPIAEAIDCLKSCIESGKPAV